VVYLDCNASTPMEPEVARLMGQWLADECGNASSRTHEYGLKAKRAVGQARKHLSELAGVTPEEVIFTSGATESNNLAILGLASAATDSGKKHIITTAIEHSAVLAPIDWLRKTAGFQVTILPCGEDGLVDPSELRKALRTDTFLVSVMQVNNETGVIQDIQGFASVLADHPSFFHVDGAQGFGKERAGSQKSRVDLLSVTAHKLYGPQGIGALIVRRNSGRDVPLQPLVHGGGQERGFRPGTQPVHLIVGFGLAAKLAGQDFHLREASNLRFREELLSGLSGLPLTLNGDQSRVLPHVLNFSVTGISSEAAMVALRNLIAVSNGSACSSARYEPSHVLRAMGLSPDDLEGAMRFSWCHMTPAVNWSAVKNVLESFIS
jgi:cysteine desulfurase